ncbi:unnamed protein product [Acanthoscelides obtectus]|uniref:Uncharacterized protein n=1 Tax=Acanthoscelides obtectus TaxID=200917 RepID=A0A9P0M6A8_ACAOB|nr:unnamed protein product [Acanthoscelides obtectus]CAK1670439.1 hypothetical protein AOBTE_LOCUS27640 [Acanthoscelides obtectus]
MSKSSENGSMNWNLMTNKKIFLTWKIPLTETLQEDEIIEDDCSSTSEQEYVPSDHEEEDSELEAESVDQDSDSSCDNVQSDHVTGVLSQVKTVIFGSSKNPIKL